jgi:hypothetical protein
MKRIQIHIDEELDEAAASEAARRGVSKAALIRESLAAFVSPSPSTDDPWAGLDGWLDDEPVDHIDEVIYGLRSTD